MHTFIHEMHVYVHKKTYKNVHRCTVHNNTKLETIQCLSTIERPSEFGIFIQKNTFNNDNALYFSVYVNFKIRMSDVKVVVMIRVMVHSGFWNASSIS